MGNQLLGNIRLSCQLDQHSISSSLSENVGLESKSIDFVLAFPQADLDVPVYMELPAGMQIPGAAYPKQHVLLLKKSLYGLKQASANWYDKLKNSLQLRGFHESVANPCVFIKGSPTSSHGECDTIVHDTPSAPAQYRGNR